MVYANIRHNTMHLHEMFESCLIFRMILSEPVVPPAPSNVTATHPLLVRQPEPALGAGTSASRVHRVGRNRGRCHYNPSTQTLHVHYSANRQPNPPAILQRYVFK